jgi:hypothetical protein
MTPALAEAELPEIGLTVSPPSDERGKAPPWLGAKIAFPVLVLFAKLIAEMVSSSQPGSDPMIMALNAEVTI